jgi:hypothetical protein
MRKEGRESRKEFKKGIQRRKEGIQGRKEWKAGRKDMHVCTLHEGRKEGRKEGGGKVREGWVNLRGFITTS